MSVGEIAAPSASGRESSLPEPYSDAWWQERSAEELREIMDKGYRLGPAFAGATAEVERRARLRLHDEEAEDLALEAHSKRARRLIFEGVILTCMLILIAVILVR